MSSFTSPFKVKVHNVPLKEKPFEVLEDFRFFSAKYPEVVVNIPIGYRSDFASVPRVFWAIVPPIGKYSKACVVHDWLIDNIENHNLSINKINKILFEGMSVLKVGKFNKYLIYGGVLFYWKFGKHISNFVRKIINKEIH